eukprot:ANDGO_07225.mRNA.1 hypothetical protein
MTTDQRLLLTDVYKKSVRWSHCCHSSASILVLVFAAMCLWLGLGNDFTVQNYWMLDELPSTARGPRCEKGALVDGSVFYTFRQGSLVMHGFDGCAFILSAPCTNTSDLLQTYVRTGIPLQYEFYNMSNFDYDVYHRNAAFFLVLLASELIVLLFQVYTTRKRLSGDVLYENKWFELVQIIFTVLMFLMFALSIRAVFFFSFYGMVLPPLSVSSDVCSTKNDPYSDYVTENVLSIRSLVVKYVAIASFVVLCFRILTVFVNPVFFLKRVQYKILVGESLTFLEKMAHRLCCCFLPRKAVPI